LEKEVLVKVDFAQTKNKLQILNMKHGSLFSGIGGFDLAAEWMGWDNIFHCELNPFGQKILKHYWPNSISYDDITKTDFTIHRGSIDIVTGGFPCQPYSLAGERKGKEDERHLWPEMLRAIREIQPRWVVGENVRGLINWSEGMVFDEVQIDLEDAGYEVMPFLLPACAVNAPHRRDRIWFVAYSKSWRGRKFTSEDQGRENRRSDNNGELQYASDTDSRGLEGSKEVGRNGKYAIWKSINGNASDTDSYGCYTGNSQHEIDASERRVDALGNFGKSHVDGNASDSDSKILEYRNGKRTAIGRAKQEVRIKSFDGTKSWETFPTQSPICGGDDGLPTQLDGITFPKWRNESIKGYGNAIVPQVVFQIFKAIEQYETTINK
jgi:DNA (cytosine-5)-methyltransferase 1